MMTSTFDDTSRPRALGAASVFESIVYRSAAMSAVLGDIRRIAPIDVSVLLLGENGTGKELLAQAIHDLSRRAKNPFIAVNCPAIPETLLESELFGHERGAFTGAVQQAVGKIEAANGGTLFLDEIGDMPSLMQVKLLRFLQSRVIERVGSHRSRQIDVRIVAATNQNLEQQIAEGRFRQDLFYRINQVTVQVPSLRQREGEAGFLAIHFLRRFANEHGRDVRAFTPDALREIEAYSWPGNVRELENRVMRAVIMARGPRIAASDLGLAEEPTAGSALRLRHARQRAEGDVVRQALAQCGSNLSQTAKLLGISRPTLYGLLRQHGIATSRQRRSTPVAPDPDEALEA